MRKERYELQPAADETAVSIRIVQLDIQKIVRNLIRDIPPGRIAQFLVNLGRAQPTNFPPESHTLDDLILLVEGDMAGLLIRNRWGGDDESQIEPLLKALARASTGFYDTLEGQVRLQKIRSITLELLNERS